MSPFLFLAASLAGGIGASLRYVVDIGVMRLTGNRFPWGIVVVNITGCFGLGFVVAALPSAAFVLGSGLLGGYTTFSTAMLDALILWREERRPIAIAHLFGTLLACAVAALLGLSLGTIL